jgi:hypothetical protein
MKASHQTTLLDQVTITVMDHHRLQAMDKLSIRSLYLHQTMALDMVILGTVLLHQASTMGSHQQVHSKATLNRQIPMPDLHMVDLHNGLPEAVLLQEMVLTRLHLLHLMPRQPSNLLLMVRRTLQLDLMGMLNRVTHSRVRKRRQLMVRVLRQDQGTVSKVAMRNILHRNLHMVISQHKTMPTTGTRVAQLILTMQMLPTRSRDMLLHQQLASLDMVRLDTLNHLQIRQVMISQRHQQQLKVVILHRLQIHSLQLRRACHRSLLLLDMVGSGLHEFCFLSPADSKIQMKIMFCLLCTPSGVRNPCNVPMVVNCPLKRVYLCST